MQGLRVDVLRITALALLRAFDALGYLDICEALPICLPFFEGQCSWQPVHRVHVLWGAVDTYHVAPWTLWGHRGFSH